MKKLPSLLFLLLVITSCTSEKMENIVVIGGGLMGSATAWELAKNGEKILLFEKQDSVYTHGSSFGEARISRVLGEKEDIFSYIQKTSVRQTGELIDFLSSTPGGSAHFMADVYTTSPVTYLYYYLEESEAQALISGQDIRTSYASNAQNARDIFQMSIPDSMSIIREYAENSGTLNPKALIGKLHEAIGKTGGSIEYNTKVTSVRREGKGYRLTLRNTQTGETKSILSKKVVSAAGPYTGELLKDIAPYFSSLITPKRLFLAFFKIDDEAYESLSEEDKNRLKDGYPVADISFEIFYSMIEKYEDGVPVLKVGGHLLRTDIADLDQVWNEKLTDEEISWSVNNTVRYLKMLNLPLDSSALNFYTGYSCVYSLTESEVPYVTSIVGPDGSKDPNFVVVGGMSGIGAKGSLAYGLFASDLLLGRTDSSEMYLKTIQALGFERMMNDRASASDYPNANNHLSGKGPS